MIMKRPFRPIKKSMSSTKMNKWFSCFFVLLLLSINCIGQNYKLIETGAILLDSISPWCSAPDEYSTAELKGNQPISSCYDKPFVYGKWFKFKAVNTLTEIKVKVVGKNGSMQWPRVSVWDEKFNELACQNSIDDTANIRLNYTKYELGKWYYISVNHNNHPKYIGSFDLCLSSKLDYDYIEGSTFIGNTANWSSANGAFSTSSASPDGKKPSCMTNGPNFNRWFQFVAKSNSASIEVKVGENYGTMKNPYVALFDKNMNEIDCDKYVDNVECKINTEQLKIGETHFISVDHSLNVAYQGSFTLLLNNASEVKENIPTKIADFEKTDLIQITGKILYDLEKPKKDSKIWLLSDKNIKVDSTKTDVNGEFNFKGLSPDQNFLMLLDADKEDLKVEIFQTDGIGQIIKRAVRLNKIKYGFENLNSKYNNIVLIDCSSNFNIKIDQGKTGLIGKVVESEQPIHGMSNLGVTLYEGANTAIANTKTNSQGEFEFTNLPPNSNYQIKLDTNSNEIYTEILMVDDNGKPFMSSNSKNMDNNGFFKFEKLPFITQQELNLIMDDDIELTDFSNLTLGNNVTLNNIHFESGKSELLSRSYRELNQLVQTLKQNSSYKIEIQGHTDNIGSSSSNKILSENRAKTVVDYLVDNGIQKNRLTFSGQGDSKPISDNSTEDGRKKNRRVEYVVVE